MWENWLPVLFALIVELSACWEQGEPLWKLPGLPELSEFVLKLELGETLPPESALLPSPSPSPAPALSPPPVFEESLPPLPELSEPPAPMPEPTPLPYDFSGELYTRRTELEPDISALLGEELCQTLPAEGPQILIYHTHGSEAYTPSEGWEYTPTDEYRTTESARNMIRVGEELKAVLEARGFRVLHDTTLCDYPSYNGSYSRSELVVQRYLQEYPSLAVVLDVHRDAIGEGKEAVPTLTERDGERMAQVMLLTGTGEIGLEHPRWRENFKLALRLQGAMNAAHPGLARPIELVPERYNQQYTTGSLLLEVGSTGNTLPEALSAVREFGESLADVLGELPLALEPLPEQGERTS